MAFENYPWNATPPSYGAKAYPTRVINNQDILEFGEGQQQTLIGKTMDYVAQLEHTCQQAIETAERYYSRLVELGDIVPEKSQGEINAELLKTIQELNDKITNLEGAKDGLDTNSTGSCEAFQPRTGKTGKRENEEIPTNQ